MPTERRLMRGSHVVGEAAVLAGCRYYFGYPITPQNELPEYLSAKMLEVGGTFVQAESEIAAINMVLGAAAAGGRAMTSSSSPGIALKQEAISYMCGQELPAVIINMMRGGPGLGNIAPSAADYFQVTRGGGNGDYHTPVLAPASCQELAELTFTAFDVADKYRTPVMIVGDGLLGQVMEPVVFPDPIDPKTLQSKDYILDGCAGREPRAIYSLLLGDKGELYYNNLKLQDKYDRIRASEVLFEDYLIDGAEIIVVAYGTASRIARAAVDEVRNAGLNAGLFRPITLWPFPTKQLRGLIDRGSKVAVFELSMGQMVEDVVLSVLERAEIFLYGIAGGLIPTPEQLEAFIRSVAAGDGKVGRRIQL